MRDLSGFSGLTSADKHQAFGLLGGELLDQPPFGVIELDTACQAPGGAARVAKANQTDEDWLGEGTLVLVEDVLVDILGRTGDGTLDPADLGVGPQQIIPGGVAAVPGL